MPTNFANTVSKPMLAQGWIDMNERIKELAEQAGFKVNWQHEDVQAIKMARFEKFAELIVRECMDTIAESREARHTAYYYRNRVAEHFGVEE